LTKIEDNRSFMIMYALGIDIGTTTICALLLDAETGAAAHVLTEPNDSVIFSGKDYERLQDPEKIAAKVESLLLRMSERHKPDCIGISCQMHGIVYVDGSCRAVSPLYTWQDGRGDLLCAEHQAKLPAAASGQSWAALLSEISGYPMVTGFGLTTHFWFTRNGGFPGRAAKLMTIGDYAAFRLSAGFTRAGGTDHGGRSCFSNFASHMSNAASLGLFDIKAQRFDDAALKNAGIDEDILPPVTCEFKTIGKTTDGIPVCAAIGDNQASFLGAVRDMEKGLLVNVGTGSQVSLALDAAAASADPPEGLELRPLTEKLNLLCGSSLCGGDAWSTLEQFFRKTAAMAGPEVISAYPAMDRRLSELAEEDFRSDPLFIKTIFKGTRVNPALRGSIANIGISNFTPEAFMLGTLAGIAGELFEMYNRAAPALPRRPEILLGAGNGIRKNPALQKTLERVFGLPLVIPLHREEACFGAALAALTCVEGSPCYKDIQKAQKLIQYNNEKNRFP
jgi:sedoheptulokinase